MPGFNPNTEDGWVGFIIALSLSTQVGSGCDQGGGGGWFWSWPEGWSGHSWSGHDPSCGQQSHSGKVEITNSGVTAEVTDTHDGFRVLVLQTTMLSSPVGPYYYGCLGHSREISRDPSPEVAFMGVCGGGGGGGRLAEEGPAVNDTESKRYVMHACQAASVVVAPWSAARQAPLSMALPRQEYWSGLPFPSPGGLPDPGIQPTSLEASALAGAVSLPIASNRMSGGDKCCVTEEADGMVIGTGMQGRGDGTHGPKDGGWASCRRAAGVWRMTTCPRSPVPAGTWGFQS